MDSASDVKSHLTNVLKTAAGVLKLKKFFIDLNTNVETGDGFLGEFFKASILDEDTATEHHIALKRAPSDPKRRQEQPIGNVFKNEIFFYSEILPILEKFERDHEVEPFKRLPKCITVCKEIGKEVIALDDITFDGFELRRKDLQLDDEHVEFIFKTYGHFHAVSFCLRKKRPEVFSDLSGNFYNAFQDFFQYEVYQNMFEVLLEECYDTLDPVEDAELREKFKKYVERPKDLFLENYNYTGEYFGIIHGDSWTNNMMFKYQDSKLVDIKIFDFQLTNIGSPIFDLSYFFYIGGSKELFDNLEHYLDIYHRSFSTSAKKLGCDPEKLLPRRVLSEEWKIYSRVGMMLALFLTKTRLISKEESIEINEAISKGGDACKDSFKKAKFDRELFKKRVHELLTHLNENGTL